MKALLEGLSAFPDNRVIRLNNADEGTANNIVVTSSVAIPTAAYQVLYILNVTQENTGPVTVSGTINRDLVTNINQPVPAGYLMPGMALLCIDTGTELRLLSYGDAEAILAAAEDAAARAEAAASGVNLPEISAADAGKSLIVNQDGTGYDVGLAVEFATETQAKAPGTPENDGLVVNLLRTLQQGQARGFFSLKDFATTVIDNGSNSAISALQSAVNSGETVVIPKTDDSYLFDGDVIINNPVKLRGASGGSKIKRVGAIGRFLLRANHINIGDFIEDGSEMTGQAALFHFDTIENDASRYIQHTLIENVRSFNSGGLIDDNNVKGAAATPYVWDILIRNVYAFGCRGRGIRMRDGFAFLRFEDVEIGLGPQYGGVSLPAYEFRNFEGLFLRRTEATGLDGYTDLGYVPDAEQRGFIFADGAALHINSLFADNNKGDGVFCQNVQYVDGNDLNSSIDGGTGFNFINVDRININTIRSGGRRNMAPGNLNTVSQGISLNANCQTVIIGNAVTHNW
ncbi:hypothetical protein B992_01258 [Brucella abortus 63/144]|nr:hypothetical protein C084_00827 [Brucella abortus 64/122]ENR45912.1 hypothetical protein B993_00672 [Brucella abortus 355/78]ENR57760.1 hypothetical protein B994_00672 [Brucella abortus 63/138]ENR60293.1 hypothetical protein B992_01258 [Brucella abortus 63/144]ENS07871.1 hypothetical protein C085_00890 [Brucella abortus 877/67]